MDLHQFLVGSNADPILRERLRSGADPNKRAGVADETLLHVAVRRRRAAAAAILLEFGADIDAENAFGKTPYAHAARRGFSEVAELLARHGARTELTPADRFAVAVVEGRLGEARKILRAHPTVARTGNPGEDRLLADVAGRHDPEPVVLLIAAGADLTATGLDDGTPLHQAAWFGQPENARLLIAAGAPLDVFDAVHNSSPLGWAVHGSRYSGGADHHADAYLELVRMLLDAGSTLHYPDDPHGNAYRERLLTDATPPIRRCLLQEPRRGADPQTA